MNYRPRIADKLLENKLKGMGAVLVEGAKWCGKTTTSEQHAGSVLYMDNPKYVLIGGLDPAVSGDNSILTIKALESGYGENRNTKIIC